ncbi:methyl-viologen-reducing hydrogenase subunit delta [candidate division TA06 bacterium DG_24]|jgi:F420-non-reducing hydrogenase iron-sulfur subunit|uniref:Methyl-viologen-reducing hydrogenase subunit delta n=3 Tax=Bacteria division TA06 TaxID=1156500 RepID=A0A0S8JJN6_UNCT6|nr:MAG: methyl-viologen-reducing hydrogenase subunit delta [candidate division TA06 bacterium DG_24]KPK68911.1 MAG: methyl-viologen-reducing hydrogenase subunit delta [candidate division TA06 bacterium SM23_40]KPL09020.1 MAG: methyl-viologen-reducing hydrogenase subunit delta [candidate division TA06 bacterium SM1_40]
MREDWEPDIIVFACNWCSYAGADSAGVSRLQYPPSVRLIRTMCSGRVSASLIFEAFRQGADGVLVTGCHIGDCHYVDGNERCQEMMEMTIRLARTAGIDERRLGLEWISAAEAGRFAAVMAEFVERIRDLGPMSREDRSVSSRTPGGVEEAGGARR